MSVELQSQAEEAFGEIEVPRAEISQLLIELGFDLTHPLAETMILAAADVLIAVNLAQTLPGEGDLRAAIGICKTVGKDLPEIILLVQAKVLDLLKENAPAMDASRLQILESCFFRHATKA